jgi:membrane protein required for colicin V production
MNTIDIIIVLVLLWGAINGFIKGFVIQSLTLVALLLGIWAGIHLSGLIDGFLLSHYSLNSKLIPIVSFTIIFILVLIIIHFIGIIITSAIDETIISKLNRLGGIVFGILKMAFILSICILILGKLDVNHKFITFSDINKSYLFKPVQKIAPAIFPHVHFEEIRKGLINGTR